MFSNVPAALPILKAPATMAPTVDGPIIHFPFSLAMAAISLAYLSGIPSAIMAMVRIESVSKACMVVGYAER